MAYVISHVHTKLVADENFRTLKCNTYTHYGEIVVGLV